MVLSILSEKVCAYMRMVNKMIKVVYNMRNHYNLYELIDKSEVISFDIYDTLLQRDVACPTDLFIILEMQLVKENHAARGFASCRIRAEKLAAQKHGEFTTIEHIYEELCHINPEFSQKKYKDLEIDLEVRLTSFRQDMYKMYMYALKKGKRVFLISDMYLPEKVISNLLMANGIKNYEELFVSCEYGVSKRNGGLFELVKSKYGICYDNWLHIGDNIISDWLIPRKKGLRAYNIASHVNYLYNIIPNTPRYSFGIRQMYKYIQNRLSDKDDYYKIGYSVFGPILYSVTRWIHESTQKDNVDIILFAARDGYLFEKAYKNISNNKKSRYILISRKSLMIPMMSMGVPVELYLNLFFPNLPKKFSVKLFLGRLGFSEEEIGQFLDEYGHCIVDEYDKEVLIKTGQLQKIYNAITLFFKNKISDVTKAFSEYLDINYLKDKKIAFFDLGVRGTIQKCLEIILNKNIDGYYLYVDKRTYHLKYAKGYFANGAEVYHYSCFYSLLEIVFSAPHGSVKSYISLKRVSKVICSKYENLDTDNHLTEIRKAAMIFNEDAINDNVIFNIDLSAQDYFSALKIIGLNPSNTVINLLKGVKFSNGLGNCLLFIHGKSFSFNLLSMWKDYKLSAWKVGCLYSKFGILGKFIPLGKLLLIFGLLKNKFNNIRDNN